MRGLILNMFNATHSNSITNKLILTFDYWPYVRSKCFIKFFMNGSGFPAQ